MGANQGVGGGGGGPHQGVAGGGQAPRTRRGHAGSAGGHSGDCQVLGGCK